MNKWNSHTIRNNRRIEDLKTGEHLCCIYQNEREHRAVITPFLRDGLEKGEKVIYIVDTRDKKTVLGYLQKVGVCIDSYLKKGQLILLTCHDAYLKEGVFDPDMMISLLRSETEKALEEDHSALRVSGEMSWALRGLPGSERLIEAEVKLNKFFPGSKCLALCQYDRRRFAPELLLDVLRTHPVAIVGTGIYENFYYIPPTELLNADPSASELKHWIETLKERQYIEYKLRRSIYDPGERVKEVNCLYEIEKIAGEERIKVPQGLEKIVQLIPQAWQYPELTGCRISFNGREYKTNDFKQTKWRLQTDIVVNKKRAGSIEVCWIGELPNGDEGPFLAEERDLLNAVTVRLGQFIEHSLTERALRESEEQYRNLVEKARIAILIDDEKGCFKYFNKRFTKIFGYTLKELKGNSILIIVHPSDRRRVLQFHKARLQGKKVPSRYEFKGLSKDGSVVYIAVDAVPLEENGRIYGSRSYIWDITERKKTNEAVLDMEKKVRLISDNIPALISYIGADGRYRFVNKQYNEWFDIPDDKIIGKHFSQVLGQTVQKKIEGFAQKALSGQRISFVDALEYKHSGKRWVFANLVPDTDSEGKTKGFYALVSDVTQAIQTHDELQASEEKYRSLVESYREPIYLVDRDCRYIFMNKAHLKRFNLPEERVLRRKYSDFHSEKETSRFKSKVDSVFKIGKSLKHEYQSERDGKVFLRTFSPVRGPEGKIKAVTVISKDISMKKKIERALRENEIKYRSLIENTNMGFVTTDLKGKFSYANKAICRMIGYSQREILGTHFSEYLHSDDKEQATEKLSELFKHPRRRVEVEFRVVSQKGRVLYMYSVPSAIKMNKKIVGFNALITDITERKLAEEERERLQARLMQSEKMAGIGTLTSGIAHEFNNLLQIMSGNVQLAQRTRRPEDMAEALEIVANISDRTTKIIRELLTFSRQDIGEKEPCNVSDVVESVLSLTEGQLRKCNIEVVRGYKETSELRVDKGELQQVFLNMVTNARDAMTPSGGILRIDVRERDGNVEVRFGDTGEGIEERDLGRIFEPFYTTKGAVGGSTSVSGTGLGLSVSYGIVKRHGGEIEVESGKGEGTVFTVRLPVYLPDNLRKKIREK